MSDREIIKCSHSNISDIRKLALPIFTESFKDILSPAQNQYMLDWMYSEKQIQCELDRGCEYFLLKSNGENVGYTALELVEPDKNAYKLHKIYLSHAMHGKGLGKFQLQQMENIAAERGGASIKLNVNRSNKAVDFYKRQGWSIIDTVDNDIGDGFYMNDYVMEKKLVS